MARQPHTQKTNASATIAGFTYQEYYFLNELIKIEMGQSVSFETEDDVYLSWESGKAVFVQIKHTSQQNSTISELDINLWKTLYNWASIICDPASGRTDPALQMNFLNEKTFRFVTNSKIDKNIFFQKLSDFQNNSINLKDFRIYLKSLLERTINNTIKKYINELLTLNSQILKKLFLSIEIEKGEADMISKCKESIRGNKIRGNNKIDIIFQLLSSKIKEDIHNHFNKREKFIVSFTDFENNYGQYFEKLRTEQLSFQNINHEIPADILKFTFMRQLLDIGHVNVEERIDHIKMVTNFFNLKYNLIKFEQDGDITHQDIETMESSAMNVWDREFRHAYRSISPDTPPDDLKEKALDIVYNLRRERTELASTPLGPDMNDGVFYELSDRPIIGWLRNWEERYK